MMPINKKVVLLPPYIVVGEKVVADCQYSTDKRLIQEQAPKRYELTVLKPSQALAQTRTERCRNAKATGNRLQTSTSGFDFGSPANKDWACLSMYGQKSSSTQQCNNNI